MDARILGNLYVKFKSTSSASVRFFSLRKYVTVANAYLLAV